MLVAATPPTLGGGTRRAHAFRGVRTGLRSAYAFRPIAIPPLAAGDRRAPLRLTHWRGRDYVGAVRMQRILAVGIWAGRLAPTLNPGKGAPQGVLGRASC